MAKSYKDQIKELNKKYGGTRQKSEDEKRTTDEMRRQHEAQDRADREADRVPQWLTAKKGTKEREEQDRRYGKFTKDLQEGKYGKAGRYSHEVIKDDKERERAKRRYEKNIGERDKDAKINITSDIKNRYLQASPNERRSIIEDISAGVGTYREGGKYSYSPSDFEKIQSLRSAGEAYNKRKGRDKETSDLGGYTLPNLRPNQIEIPQTTTTPKIPTGMTPDPTGKFSGYSRGSAEWDAKRKQQMADRDTKVNERGQQILFEQMKAKAQAEGKDVSGWNNIDDALVSGDYVPSEAELDKVRAQAESEVDAQGQPSQQSQPTQPSQEELMAQQREAQRQEYLNTVNQAIQARKQAEQARLAGARTEQVQALQERARQLTEQADLAKTQADVQSQRTERGLEEQLATTGLQRGGTAEQRRLGLATATGQRMGDITRQEMTGQRQISQEQQNVERRYQDSLTQLEAQTAQLQQQAVADANQMNMAQQQLDETKRQFNESMKMNNLRLAEEARRFDVGLANDMRKFYDNLSVNQSQFNAQMKNDTDKFNAQLQQRQNELAQQYQFQYDQLNTNVALSQQERQDKLAQLDRDYDLNMRKINQDLMEFNATQNQKNEQYYANIAFQYDKMAQQSQQFSQELAQRILQQKQQYQLGWGRINSNEKLQREKMAQTERLSKEKEESPQNIDRTVIPYQKQINNMRSEITKYNTSVYGGAERRDANTEVKSYIDKLFTGGNINEEQWKYLYDVNNL